MTADTVTLETWRRLYDLAIQLKELAPWEWMEEADIFGVQDPETGDLGFVSIMGALGEHYALALYQGAEGLYKFWAMQEAGPQMSPEDLLETPQLQLSFEDRDQLQAREREIIKKLGLKFRGRQAWPQFTSYRPGFAPWFLVPEEARFLTLVLEQALEVTARFAEDLSLLEPAGDETTYLVRVARPEGNRLVWEDRPMQVPPPEPATISLVMDVPVLERLATLPQSKQNLEMDLFMFPSPVQEKGERPFFLYTLMIVEAQSGMVLGHDMLRADPSLEDMWGQVPLHIVHQLARAGIRPREIRVRSPLLLQLLQSLTGELGFRLKHSRILPALDPAKEFLMQRFM